MTFLNDLWKKFKETHEQGPASKTSDADTTVLEKFNDLSSAPLNYAEQAHHSFNESEPVRQSPSEAGVSSLNKGSTLEKAKDILSAFRQTETENLEMKTVVNNLNKLKNLVNEPKEDISKLRFTQIKQHLGPAESHETIRQERWPVEIYCPKCQSNHLKRIPQTSLQSPHNHRYRCLECGTEFNDDSGTPMEQGIPPLNVWMQCWYLMGSTGSVSYIANQLGINLGVAEMMIRQLQKTFNTKQPLTRFIEYGEWSKQSQHLRVQLKEDLLREYERLNANIATVPKDTAEYRKQLNLRRNLTPTTAPPSPRGPKR